MPAVEVWPCLVACFLAFANLFPCPALFTLAPEALTATAVGRPDGGALRYHPTTKMSACSGVGFECDLDSVDVDRECGMLVGVLAVT